MTTAYVWVPVRVELSDDGTVSEVGTTLTVPFVQRILDNCHPGTIFDSEGEAFDALCEG